MMSSSPCSLSPSTIPLLLLPLVLLALTLFVIHPFDFQLQSVFPSTSCPPSTNDNYVAPTARTTAAATPTPDFRLLMGILTHPDNYERRHLIRLAYSLQGDFSANLDIRFVFCNLTKEEQTVLIALEIIRYDDIIILDCEENMDKGKTYTYFSTLPKILDATYDYVMKTDDDTYFRLENLVGSLKNKPKTDMYSGLVMPCDTENFFPFPPYMSGMGYILSWDLVEWIATSELTRKETEGPEDMWTGRWMNMANRAKNRFDNAPAMYDFKGPFPTNCFRHDFIPDTIAVHKLKDNSRWASTLKYFNVTKGLKPSKLYHIP
ncbi:beta-1,3-galactosyltransferase pvg3-like [Typha latifolia]|uniref:beta-1,3-galactosyltransferase pvg3-like n=1 Tax=Typha latifolia TaxID=4733 RepID=UPI003C2E18F5